MTTKCDTCGRELPATDTETNSAAAGLTVQAANYCSDCGRVIDE